VPSTPYPTQIAFGGELLGTASMVDAART
jgi:hypothetical protein